MGLDPVVVDRVVAEATKRQANLDYFFDQLDSPDWIEPLAERGLFREPPPQLVDEEGFVRAPSWSASRFLARVAPAAPELALTVIRTISSDNERVHEDFEDAALAMPLGAAAEVAEIERAWISTRDRIYYQLPQKAVALIERLVNDGEVAIGFALFNAIFEPLPDNRDAEWHVRHAQSRVPDWEYDHLLRELTPKLAERQPATTIVALAELLESAVAMVFADDRAATRLWRARIASDQHRALDVEDALLSALRDSAELIVDRGLLRDSELGGLLIERSEPCRRVLAHVLARSPSPNPVIACRLMADVDELAHYEPSVEFRELLRAHAALLEPEALDELLAVIEKGPDLDVYRDIQERFGGRAPTAEEERMYVARWKVGRLSLLRDVLTGRWEEEFDELVELVGDVPLPVSGEVRTFVGPTSPKSVDDLTKMSDDEVVELLRDWDGDGRWEGPSAEGLARTFSAFAEGDPGRASVIMPRLTDARPAYIQWGLLGLENAVRQARAFLWDPVLALLDWVSAQPREREGGRGDDYDDLDPGWVWTRKAIAALVDAGLNTTGDASLPYDQRVRIWSIIERVAADPDPTPADEDRYGGHNMDPATLALNTTRPRAIAAAISYARWVYRALDRDGASSRASFFEEKVPEVAKLLESHLDPEQDVACAVRAVAGQHFPGIFALDNSWAADHADAFFPEEDSALREAGWGAYVIYSPAYNNLLTPLHSHYLRAAELTASDADRFRWMHGDPRTRLGEHLATFYLRGVISEQDELLSTYWRNAPDVAKEGVIEFIGSWLREAQELSLAVLDRAQVFFDWASDRGDAGLASFSWWVPVRDLPAGWRLGRLELLAERRVRPAPAFLIAEELPNLAQVEPLRSVRILRRLLEEGAERWSVDAWQDRIIAVLRTALESGDIEAQHAADEVLNWLGALGYRGFRALAQHQHGLE